MRVYQIITESIIRKLEEGVIPWHKSWTGGFPVNHVTKRPYKGINALLTGSAPYSCTEWLTFHQIQSLGLHLHKGAKSTVIVYFGPKNQKSVDSDSEDAPALSSPSFTFRYYHVYNLEQTNYPVEIKQDITLNGEYAECQAIVSDWKDKPSIFNGGAFPCYIPSRDYISIPDIGRFDSPAEYYSTLFHELIHSTGHPSRLNRKTLQGVQKWDDAYSMEELVAEIGGSFLCGLGGISAQVIDNQAAYIKGWLSTLKTNTTLIVKSAHQAQLATDYITEHQHAHHLV